LNTNIRGQQGYNKTNATFDPAPQGSLEEHRRNLDKFSWIFKG